MRTYNESEFTRLRDQLCAGHGHLIVMTEPPPQRGVIEVVEDRAMMGGLSEGYVVHEGLPVGDYASMSRAKGYIAVFNGSTLLAKCSDKRELRAVRYEAVLCWTREGLL